MAINKNTKNQRLTSCQNSQEARIVKWQEKLSKETAPFKFHKIDDNTLQLKANDYVVPTDECQEKYQSTISFMTGVTGQDYNNLVFSSLTSAFFKETSIDTIANANSDALMAMAPQDVYEGSLCRRLLVLENQYLCYFNRAVNTEYLDKQERYNNMAIKLMRMYNETLDTLNKHRRKEQKITVQHVNVNEGGQAIVTEKMEFSGGA